MPMISHANSSQGICFEGFFGKGFYDAAGETAVTLPVFAEGFHREVGDCGGGHFFLCHGWFVYVKVGWGSDSLMSGGDRSGKK
jgi:hypothetical protein